MVYVPPIKRKRKHGPTVGITGIKLLTNNSSTISQKPFVEPASDPYDLLEAYPTVNLRIPKEELYFLSQFPHDTLCVVGLRILNIVILF